MGNNNSTQNNTRGGGGGGQEENDDTSSLEGAFSQGGGSSHHSTYEHGPVTQTVPIPGAQSSHLNNITGGGFGGGRGGGGGEALEPALVPVAITCASCFSPRSSEFSMRRSFYRSRRLPRRPLRQGGGGVFTLDVSFVFASGRYGRRASADAVFQKDAFTLVLNSSRVLFTHALASLSLSLCVYPSRIFKTNRDARRFGRGSRRLLRRMANADAAPSVWE